MEEKQNLKTFIVIGCGKVFRFKAEKINVLHNGDFRVMIDKKPLGHFNSLYAWTELSEDVTMEDE